MSSPRFYLWMILLAVYIPGLKNIWPLICWLKTLCICSDVVYQIIVECCGYFRDYGGNIVVEKHSMLDKSLSIKMANG